MLILIGLAGLLALLLLWVMLARWHATATWAVVKADGTRMRCSGVDGATKTAHFAAYAVGPDAIVRRTGLRELTVTPAAPDAKKP